MKSENFIKGLLKFGLGPIGAAAISFFTVPITTWLVPPEEFGKTVTFTLIQSFITMFIYLGLDQAYIRDYSRKVQKDNFLNNMLIPSLVLGGIVSLILFFMSARVAHFLEVDRYLIFLLILWIPFVIFERFLLLNIRLKEKGLSYSLFNILGKLCILILTVILLIFWKKGYQSVILGATLGQIICNIILIIYSWKTINIRVSVIDITEVKSSLTFGLPFLPAFLLWWGFSSTDRLILSAYSNYEEIGIYSAALKIVGVLAMCQTIFSSYWVPVAHRWYEEKVSNFEYTKVSQTVFFLMSIVFMILLICKGQILYILSPKYGDAATVLPFLLFHPIMYTVSETTVLGISFSRKTYYNIWISIIVIIISIATSMILVPKIGAIGAAIGNGISYIVFFWARTVFSRRLWYKFSLKYYLFKTIILLIAALINTFSQGVFVYICNFIILVIILVVNKDIILAMYRRLNVQKIYHDYLSL